MACVSCSWTISLVVISLVYDGVLSECPQNVLSSATQCFPSHFSNGLISNLTAVQQHCQNGMFEESLVCLTRIEASCHDDRVKQQLLHSYMDVPRWKASWNELCTSVTMLQEHSSCWTTTSTRSAECIKDQMSDLQRRLLEATIARAVATTSPTTSLQQTMTPGSALDNLKLYCNTSEGILKCFQPSLHELCSPEAARLLEDMYLAFQPPLCETDEVEDKVEDKVENKVENKDSNRAISRAASSAGVVSVVKLVYFLICAHTCFTAKLM